MIQAPELLVLAVFWLVPIAIIVAIVSFVWRRRRT
jgi:hypothetical protein